MCNIIEFVDKSFIESTKKVSICLNKLVELEKELNSIAPYFKFVISIETDDSSFDDKVID